MALFKMNEKASIGTAVFSAVSLKLCCWGPLIVTGVIGISGGSVYFSWLTILKPYLLTIAFLSLGFAFYQVYHPNREDGCENCDTKNTPFFKSKFYVWLVALFVILMTLVSYYPQLFHQITKKESIVIDESNFQSINLHIEGMVCKGCEENINHSVNKIEGVVHAKTSYKESTSVIEFDAVKTTGNKIKEVIQSMGYVIKNEEYE